MKYAIAQTSGKQFLVKPGEWYDIDYIRNGEVGDYIYLNKILFFRNENKIQIGKPFLTESKISAKIIQHVKGKKITVEVDNLNQLKKIIGLKFNTVLFDNMSVKNLKTGIKLIKKYYETEASGNISLKTVKSVAATKVDRISVGSITHSAPAIDFKLEI